MEYLALNNGVRMPLVGFGTWTLRGSEGEARHSTAVACMFAPPEREKQKTIDEEDILVVAGRGVRNKKDVEMCRRPCLGRGGHRTRVLPRRNAGIRRFSAGALR